MKSSRRLPAVLALLLTAIGATRIVSTYRAVAQTSDETPNIACGMQWLDQGRYDYGPFHPPLARIAMSIGPYLYGARSQSLPNRWVEGNAVLNSAPRYGKALTLARIGILPFFILACACVWLWSRRLMDDWSALVPLFLFTNMPPVLAHAGLATTDMAVTAGVCAAVYAFILWQDAPHLARSIVLGLAMAAAVLAKFSALLFVPCCLIGLLLLRAAAQREPWRAWCRRHAGPFLVAMLVAAITVWAAYRFSWGPAATHEIPADTPLARYAPLSLLRTLSRISIPAPEIAHGMGLISEHVFEGHAAYLMGQNSLHGWWYFFPVALALKLPLGILALAAAGLVGLIRAGKRTFDWRAWGPPICVAAILLPCLKATLNIGVRYVLALFPMLAITAGIGAVYLFRRCGRAGAIAAIALTLWAAASSVAAHPDYIPYFNELAGSRPERFLVDSDLDWGQDMNRLVVELQRRRVPSLHMACLYTGDDRRLALPAWDALEPYHPVTGWVAVSFTMLKNFGWLVSQQQGRRDTAFAWLDRYRPVARVGTSILLYHIPEEPPR
jgi:hypothetical protein